MHFSIAPIEATTHVRQQFEPARPGTARRPGRLRHRVSVALHGLAYRLEPAPTR